MNRYNIKNELKSKADEGYKQFHSALVPGVTDILGVRLPEIRKIAKRYANTEDGYSFISSMPHEYYDEYMLHGIMLGYLKTDYTALKGYVCDFLPYVDNWAVCDSLVSGLKRLFKNKALSLELIKELLASEHDYSVRFALVALLNYFCDSEYAAISLELALSVSNKDAYYIKMAVSWLVSVFLAKQYEMTVPIIEDRLLPAWVHNKSIQKARESLRISDERKAYLNSLKIRD